MKKIVLTGAIVLVITAFFLFDLNAYLTLDGLKSSLAEFRHWQQQSQLLTGLLFFLLYVVIAAFSLPGAAIMTIAAGALFGLPWGTIIASFASTLGATLAFLTARYLFRDIVQTHFSARLKAINAGIERDGIFYLFTLRLVPIFPFFW